ncbi:MAG: TonB-dependent receptor [Rhodothermaceae bacterium]|nr:TonB-dependent receptor [Rhodothermaceae bacterium]MYG69302.1 TonB-dependent receptor [Rhodothermaceae bacterium]MYJ44039.1 TonB-dependent receptor [Rhodothermaceae bacterium]
MTSYIFYALAMTQYLQGFAYAAVLVLVHLLASVPANAQSGKITGVVTDVAGEGMVGVNVLITGTTRGSSTDIDGRFFILNVEPGTYSLRASFIGFRAVTQSEVIVNINKTTTIDFILEEATTEGEELLVIAERPDVEVDQTATLEIIRPEEVEQIAGITDLSDVLGLQAEVNDGHFRGGRSNEELYVLAGMGIVNPLNSSRSFTPMLSAVEEVEVITSGFAAEYGNAMSGVINISTKEGGDSWSSRAEIRTRAPSYKHFGGSVFDPANNPYIRLMNNLEWWEAPDPENDDKPRWQGAIGRGFGSRVDPEEGAQLAYDLWKRTHRDVGYEYNNRWDALIDFTLGGPISETSRLFVATQINRVWPMLPTPEADRQMQVMGNLVMKPGSGKKLKLNAMYGNTYQQEFSYSSGGFYRWVYDRVIGANKILDQSAGIGLVYSHVLSDRTYYELTVNGMRTKLTEGVDVIDPERFRDDISDGSVWERLYWEDGFRTGVMDDDFFDEESWTYSAVGFLTSQVSNNHEIKVGIQGNLYDIDVENRLNHSSQSSAVREFYQARPYEGAVYVQDKMEFKGMITNVGLRLDFYDQNVQYYTDTFSPFRDPSNPALINERDAATEDTPIVARLQPRLGFSFPINERAVFHLNYGNYLKRPGLESLIGSRTTLFNENLGTVEPRRLGNPLLKPEETKSYDVGLVLGIASGFTLDVSGYYKDVKNLIQRVVYIDSNDNLYESLGNRDYANIRGFSLRLNKRRGFISGSARYHFSVATGKNSTPTGRSPIIDETNEQTQAPSPRDILLNFDRRHALVLIAGVNLPQNWGPRIAGGYPLGRLRINFLHDSRSGRPYTPSELLGDNFAKLNTERTPWEHNTDLKVTKTVGAGFTELDVFVEVFNLFNARVFDYNRVFLDAETLRRYENGEDIEFALPDSNNPDLAATQTFRIYDNAPRSIRLGVVFNM